MYDGNRLRREFIVGVETFLHAAMAHRPTGHIPCPCIVCKNLIEYPSTDVIHNHLILRGFMPDYTCWTSHGEEEVLRGDGDDVIVDPVEDDNMDDAFGDFCPDYLEEMILHEEAEMTTTGTTAERKKLDRLKEDLKKPLYPDCPQGLMKLRTTLELMQWKATNGVSDKAFNELLPLIKKMLPTKDNELPSTTYEAKQVLCPVGLEVQKIHACPNDCILYRGDYENLEACPVCKASRYKAKADDDPGDVEGERKKKRSPAKVMWYFPIIPRLRRLFANKEHAKLVRWHKEERKVDGKIRHPADASQWKKINRKYPDFGADARNIRFGLSTDGMNPYGEMSSAHSTWPVTLCLYNLPPWLCMKRKFIMMPVLIQGPHQPGNNMDVYLKPLFDDLLNLWIDGVEVWDEYEGKHFKLKGMLFVTINDWPALGNLAGFCGKGYKGCIYCLDETDAVRLKNCQKVVYMGHRRFLVLNHKLRRNRKNFNGQDDQRRKPAHRTGPQVFSMVKDLKVVFGKGPGSKGVPKKGADGLAPMWKKKSLFWDLPYWEDLDIRHAVDVMHLTKNVCVTLLGFLDVYGKSKDTLNARLDLEELKVRNRLHPESRGSGKHWLHPASYTLSKLEKKTMMQCLSSTKVPSGYSSNVKRLVNMKEKKIVGLKSHDCHVLMTQLLPVAVRGILPKNVRGTIIKLCSWFNAISQKVIDPEKLLKLQSDVVDCLVSLEMIFPPSFFNIMTHLMVHIVTQIEILGPSFLHNMFPFERFMAILKKYVRNRSRPEGCIANGYGTEEVIEFFVDYVPDLKAIGVPESRHEGRLKGRGTLGRKPDSSHDGATFKKAHFTVLEQSSLVRPYFEEHLDMLRSENPKKPEGWIFRAHKEQFGYWFQKLMMSTTVTEPNALKLEQLRRLSRGPSSTVVKYKGYEINGFTFYTRAQDEKSTNQNSGVRIDALNDEGQKITYYGIIEEIWEMDYGPLKVPLFRCQWVKNNKGAVDIDEFGMTSVDLNKIGFEDDPFVLAKDVTQVFYVPDMASISPPAKKRKRADKTSDHPTRHVVLQGKQRIVGVEDVTDKTGEEEYNQFEEIPPFAVDVDISILQCEGDQDPSIRTDHNEGILVKTVVVQKNA